MVLSIDYEIVNEGGLFVTYLLLSGDRIRLHTSTQYDRCVETILVAKNMGRIEGDITC